MTKVLIAALPLVLSACGETSFAVSPTAGAEQNEDNCTTPYFQEIAGVYDGQITFESADISSCVWDVDFEVAASQIADTRLNFCETTANITSTLLSGDIEQCGDLAQGGGFTQPISGGSTVDELLLENVSFPIEGNLSLNARTSDDMIFPTGFQRSTSLITVVFDGVGNVTFPESPVFSGVLVKQ